MPTCVCENYMCRAVFEKCTGAYNRAKQQGTHGDTWMGS